MGNSNNEPQTNINYTNTVGRCIPKIKNNTCANSDGLIKCLPPTQYNFVTSPKIHARNFRSIYKIMWHPGSFIYRDSIFGLAGRRAGALFFARHRDYFVLTRYFIAVYQDLVPFRNFTVTRSSLPFTGTGKKQVTATQTAPNQTAGPL